MAAQIPHILNCRALLYKSGNTGKAYQEAFNFRVEVSERSKHCVKELKEVIRSAGGLSEAALKAGLGKNIDIRLARKEVSANGPMMYAINTDAQLVLELPLMTNASHIMQVIVHEVQISFMKNKPTIQLNLESTLTAEKTNDEIQELMLTEKQKEELEDGLQTRVGSKLIQGQSVTVAFGSPKKTYKWAWKIQCGKCNIQLMLRPDSNTKGRLSYYDRHHYNTCSKSNKRKSVIPTKEDFFKPRKAQKRDMVQAENSTTYDEDIEIIDDSYLDQSFDESVEDDEFDMPATSEFEESDGSFEVSELPINYNDDSQCIETCSLSAEEENKWRIFSVKVEDADEVAKKMNQLIRDGKIDKDRIFYKYLNDVVNFFFENNYVYHPEVVEFFNSILYLGGRSTFNFLRGPMFYGQGPGCTKSKDTKTLQMNLGGPSLSTCLKQGTAFTTESGVLKNLSSIQLNLIKDENRADGKVIPIVENDKVIVYPCCYSNDGTALKPAVEYDSLSKTNVGLTTPVNYEFVKAHNPPDPELLKDLIITEAVVGSVTTLDNKNSLPVLVEYVPKAGKTGENLTNQITKHVKILQMCEACTNKTKANDLVLNDFSLCESYCKHCYDEKALCPKCIDDGQRYVYPAFRACQNCLKDGIQCTKRAILVITTDCEEGNKKMFLTMKEKIENKTIDPCLSLAVPLPDSPHLGKSLKASFSNWYLTLLDERGCLSFLHTLRNKASKEEMKTMRQLLPKNDYVRNKDRQDPVSVLKLSDPKVVSFLQNVGYVVHTLIPETTKFTNNNKVGMYPCPLSVCLGPYGYIFVLTHGTGKSKSSIYKVKLHNPIDAIEIVKSEIDAFTIWYACEKLFYCGKGTAISFIDFTKIKPEKLKSKAETIGYADSIGCEVDRNGATLKQLKKNIMDHVDFKKKEYLKNGFVKTQINLTNCNGSTPSFEAIFLSKENIFYAADKNSRSIMQITFKTDGFGINGSLERIAAYPDGITKITCLCALNGKIFVSNSEFVFYIETICDLQFRKIVNSGAHCILPFKEGIVLSLPDRHQICTWDTKKHLKPFIGTGKQGNLDGKASKAEMFQPTGLCTEFDNVIYFADYQSSSIKIVSTLLNTAVLLKSFGNLMQAFSVHERRGSFELKSLPDAINMVKDSLNTLNGFEHEIRESFTVPKALNGTHGFVSTKSHISLELTVWSLQRLNNVLQEQNYKAINMLSMMTLSVEHFHSTTHAKQALLSPLQYAISFMSSIKESLKKGFPWAAYYFTSTKGSWYPPPENTISYSEVSKSLPKKHYSQSGTSNKKKEEEMRLWAETYTRGVRQRSVRQETTMDKAGTLPHYLYSVDICKQAAQTAKYQDDEIETLEVSNEITPTTDPLTEEEPLEEFDTSSDEDVPSGITEEATVYIDDQALFLLGRRSRFGRTIKVNNRFLS